MSKYGDQPISGEALREIEQQLRRLPDQAVFDFLVQYFAKEIHWYVCIPLNGFLSELSIYSSTLLLGHLSHLAGDRASAKACSALEDTVAIERACSKAIDSLVRKKVLTKQSSSRQPWFLSTLTEWSGWSRFSTCRHSSANTNNGGHTEIVLNAPFSRSNSRSSSYDSQATLHNFCPHHLVLRTVYMECCSTISTRYVMMSPKN